MIDLILDGGPIQAAFESGDDATVLQLLNEPTTQVRKEGNSRRPGFVTNATMGKDLGQGAVAQFLVAMNAAIQYQQSLGTSEADGTAYLIDGFVNRMNTTPDGIDFANEEIRQQINLILNAAGIESEPYLALGYTLQSRAQQLLGRDATQADIDQAAGQIYAMTAAEKAQRNEAAISLAYQTVAVQFKSGALTEITDIVGAFEADLVKRWEQ